MENAVVKKEGKGHAATAAPQETRNALFFVLSLSACLFVCVCVCMCVCVEISQLAGERSSEPPASRRASLPK